MSTGFDRGPIVGWLFVLLASTASAPARGQQLGPEFQVNTYTTQGQYAPAVAAIDNGSFLVIWESQLQDGPGAGDGIYGQAFASDGSPIGDEFRVNSYTTGNQRRPSVAGSATSGFLAVWQSDAKNSSSTGIFGRYYQTSGAPDGPEFQVNSYSTGWQFGPAVSGNAAGEFIVVWTDQSDREGSSTAIFAQRFDEAGAPIGPEFQVNSYTTGAQINPSVAMNQLGGFVVVWQSEVQDGSQYGIFGRRFGANGSPLGGDFQVNSFTTGFQTYPQIAVDQADGFVVAWESSGQEGIPPSDGVFARRFGSNGIPLAGEFPVNSYTTGDQSRPSVAVDALGGVLVVWQSAGQDGSGSAVVGRNLDALGAPAGSAFRVNAYTPNSQATPTVTATGAGSFVVAWQSDGQEGPGYSHYGIYARRVSMLLFEDGFETGDVCGWSASSGGGGCF